MFFGETPTQLADTWCYAVFRFDPATTPKGQVIFGVLHGTYQYTNLVFGTNITAGSGSAGMANDTTGLHAFNYFGGIGTSGGRTAYGRMSVSSITQGTISNADLETKFDALKVWTPAAAAGGGPLVGGTLIDGRANRLVNT